MPGSNVALIDSSPPPSTVASMRPEGRDTSTMRGRPPSPRPSSVNGPGRPGTSEKVGWQGRVEQAPPGRPGVTIVVLRSTGTYVTPTSSSVASPPVARSSTPPVARTSTVAPGVRSAQSAGATGTVGPATGHADTAPPPPRRRTRNEGDDARTTSRNPVPPARVSGREKALTRRVTEPAGSAGGGIVVVAVVVVAVVVVAAVGAMVAGTVDAVLEVVVAAPRSLPSPSVQAASTATATATTAPARTLAG